MSSFVSASCVATSPIPPWCLSSNFASSVQSARPRLDHGHRASSSPPWTQLLFCHCGHPAILVCRSPSLSLIPRYRVPYSISQPFPVPSICAALTRHRLPVRLHPRRRSHPVQAVCSSSSPRYHDFSMVATFSSPACCSLASAPCELLLPRPVCSSGLDGCQRRFFDLALTLNRCSTLCHVCYNIIVRYTHSRQFSLSFLGYYLVSSCASCTSCVRIKHQDFEEKKAPVHRPVK